MLGIIWRMLFILAMLVLIAMLVTGCAVTHNPAREGVYIVKPRVVVTCDGPICRTVPMRYDDMQ